MDKTNASFLPEDYVQQRQAFRTNVLSLTLFVVVMVGVLGAFVVTNHQHARVAADQKAVNAEFIKAADEIRKVQELHVKKQQILRKAETTASLIEPAPRSVILAELINRMPATLSLSELTLETEAIKQGRSLRSSTISVKKSQDLKDQQDDAAADQRPEELVHIELVGIALTDLEVARYIRELNLSPMFENVELQRTGETTIGDDKFRQFEVNLDLKRGLNVAEIDHLPLPDRRLKQNPMDDAMRVMGNRAMEAGDDAQPGQTDPSGAQPVIDRSHMED